MQVGDVIFYKGANHTVKNFGLLSTQVMRFDGCKIWVPNNTLMTSDILNVSQSKNLTDRLTFQVDVPAMCPELCEDLAQRVADMMEKEEPRRLFNSSFIPASHILGVSDPLKYDVCLPLSALPVVVVDHVPLEEASKKAPL
jgi:small-conductance mechanosensitive channel